MKGFKKGTTMRNLSEVLDEIVKIAPELEKHFKHIRESIPYTAPELMPERWWQTCDVLNDTALDHPKQKEIAAIFSGQTVVEQPNK